MTLKSEVKYIQEILLNSWPAKEYFFLNGWILRFTDGVTSRANSVLPLNYNGNKNTIDRDIGIVENAYKIYGLPPIFTMHDYYEPKYLRSKLIEKGYEEVSFTTTMGAKVTDLNYLKVNNDYNYEIHAYRTNEFNEFLAKYSKRPIEEQQIIKEICERINIPQKRFILAKDESSVIGTTMGVLNVDYSLYIADVLVKPNYRRRRIASSMLIKLIKEWAELNGVINIWLQVENENEIAIKYYENLGLKGLFNYYYLQKSLKS
ncbi:MAG: GNAT family N-acetyltransferase [Candidatus Heimdallarchaeota archaeon]